MEPRKEPPLYREMGIQGAESKSVTKRRKWLSFVSVFIEYLVLSVNIEEHVKMGIDPQRVN